MLYQLPGEFIELYKETDGITEIYNLLILLPILIAIDDPKEDCNKDVLLLESNWKIVAFTKV